MRVQPTDDERCRNWSSGPGTFRQRANSESPQRQVAGAMVALSTPTPPITIPFTLTAFGQSGHHWNSVLNVQCKLSYTKYRIKRVSVNCTKHLILPKMYTSFAPVNLLFSGRGTHQLYQWTVIDLKLKSKLFPLHRYLRPVLVSSLHANL